MRIDRGLPARPFTQPQASFGGAAEIGFGAYLDDRDPENAAAPAQAEVFGAPGYFGRLVDLSWPAQPDRDASLAEAPAAAQDVPKTGCSGEAARLANHPSACASPEPPIRTDASTLGFGIERENTYRPSVLSLAARDDGPLWATPTVAGASSHPFEQAAPMTSLRMPESLAPTQPAPSTSGPEVAVKPMDPAAWTGLSRPSVEAANTASGNESDHAAVATGSAESSARVEPQAVRRPAGGAREAQSEPLEIPPVGQASSVRSQGPSNPFSGLANPSQTRIALTANPRPAAVARALPLQKLSPSSKATLAGADASLLVLGQDGAVEVVLAGEPLSSAEAAELLARSADVLSELGLTLGELRINGTLIAPAERRIPGGPDGRRRR